MRRSYLIAIIATVHTVATETSSSNATARGEITVHTVTVAKTPNANDPQTIFAVPGDVITFQFWSGNHSVIRAEYGYPCVPYEDIVDDAGFFSGFQPAPDGVVLGFMVGVQTCQC
ncbi:hypothetical protein LTR10_012257 [Elasticomyces elasticus]|nr:hypothetical protein LTR10_012257 [Elasticomyces elasticus]KAK4965735.1 hypothetical protein LTR42_011748 [Elasticomyces elasticus]